DNYEWAEGYRPKFGLVAIDPATQERRLKDSAYSYAEIAKANGLWLDY
ncbi:family 1 glycosylhydrolase, partial [Candidatus Kuenenbacteria bacterium]|nr:family 1 glycosylhydrolase [Candidatus Kuenenbacteria bacterium]